MSMRRRWRTELLLVMLLVAIALLVRIWQLEAYPPGLYLDEAAYGLDAQAVRAGQHAIFFERNNGREPFFIYLLALVFSVVGASAWAIRLTAAICGALTIATTWWMVHEVIAFGESGSGHRGQASLRGSSVWHAAWVAAFLAFSYWHVALSRLGFRAITYPLITTLAFALLWRALRHLQTTNTPDSAPMPASALWLSTAAGAIFGLSLYTYTAARIALLLYGVVTVAAWIFAREWGLKRRQVMQAGILTTVTALLVASPLLWYFIGHPAAFGEHAAYVSILNPRFSGGNPLAALWHSTSQTLLMLVGMAADPNLRHNPAGRAAIEWFLGIWLVAGIVLALWRWRRAEWFFALIWFLIFLAPVVISAEGVPHSLRAIGLLPSIFLLIVLAMGTCGVWLAERLHSWPGIIVQWWLPLPFLVATAITGVGAYANAWNNMDNFRGAFFTDYVALAQALDNDAAKRDLWLLPLPPGEDLGDDRLTTIDFLLNNPDHVATLRLDEATAAHDLAELAVGYSTVHVVESFGVPGLTDYDTRFMDLKGYLDLLLQANGASVVTEEMAEIAGFPFRTYRLSQQKNFVLPGVEEATNIAFGDVVHLIGLHVGKTYSSAGAGAHQPGQTLTAPADEPIWAILRWRAEGSISSGLKSSVVLRHVENNRVISQVDRPLMSDRFPRQPVWQAGEDASSYALLPVLAGVPPGHYQLELTVYDETTGIIYPVLRTDGSTAEMLPLIEVELLPATTPFASTNPTYARNDLLLAPALHLVGLDLSDAPIAPGNVLPVNLHLRTTELISDHVNIEIALRDSTGEAMVATTITPGGASYPADQWRAHEQLIAWADLALPPDLPAGSYTLTAQAHDAKHSGAELPLGMVVIAGRPRLFIAPTVTLLIKSEFGAVVRLRGVQAQGTLRAFAGATLQVPLVWQVLATDNRDLVRFVQILDDQGQLVAQQDTLPCDGQCTAVSWVEGEFLVDTAAVVLPADVPPGSYTLAIGWYDRATQERLVAINADRTPLADNVVRIPLVLERAQ